MRVQQVTPERAAQMPALEQIASIRRSIKSVCPTLSVRNSRGTAWGWVNIRGTATGCGEFTEREAVALRLFELSYGGNFASVAPGDRRGAVVRLSEIANAHADVRRITR